MLAEETCFGDATRVKRGKSDAIATKTLVELAHAQHIADFGVFVSLGTVKFTTVDHDLAVGKSREITKIGLGWHVACQGVGVSCNGSDDNHTGSSSVVVRRLLEVFQEQVCHEEVSQVVGSYRELKAIGSEARLLRSGQIDGSIAHESIESTPAGLEVGNKLSHRLEGSKINVHDGVGALGDVETLGSLLCLQEVTACHDHVPIARGGEGLGSVEAEAGRGTGDNGGGLLGGFIGGGDGGRGSRGGDGGQGTSERGGTSGLCRFLEGLGGRGGAERSGNESSGGFEGSLCLKRGVGAVCWEGGCHLHFVISDGYDGTVECIH